MCTSTGAAILAKIGHSASNGCDRAAQDRTEQQATIRRTRIRDPKHVTGRAIAWLMFLAVLAAGPASAAPAAAPKLQNVACPLSAGPMALAVAPNGARIAAADAADMVSVLSVGTDGGLRHLRASPFPLTDGAGPNAITFDRTGALLATANSGTRTISSLTIDRDGRLHAGQGSPASPLSPITPTAVEADFDRWSKRLVKTLGRERVTQTIEDLHELKRALDADAEHFEAGAKKERS